MPSPDFRRKRLNQKGQSSVFVLAFLGVVVVSAIFLFESGRITSEKMQLQNAADSAAFSAMTLEARSLNFAAYTNRAMVANEVAIGQMVGLISFADELASVGEYTDAYDSAIELLGDLVAAALIETMGVGTAVAEFVTQAAVATIITTGNVIGAVGEAIQQILEIVSEPTIEALCLINETYSVSQKIYHGATYGAVIKTVYQAIEDNVPGTEFSKKYLQKDQPGAQLSDLGIVALIGHIPSFWSGYTKVYSADTSSKKRRKKEKKKKQKNDSKQEEQDKKKEAQDEKLEKQDKTIIDEDIKNEKEDLKKEEKDIAQKQQDEAEVKSDQKIIEEDEKKIEEDKRKGDKKKEKEDRSRKQEDQKKKEADEKKVATDEKNIENDKNQVTADNKKEKQDQKKEKNDEKKVEEDKEKVARDKSKKQKKPSKKT